MSPDDPRHGEYAGYRAHRVEGEEPCIPCHRANTRYQKGLQVDLNRGHRRTVPALGARRRVQALQALGWSLRTIAREAGWRHHETLRWLLLPENDRILRSTHDLIATVYDRLSMRVPERSSSTTRARLRAAEKGYPPPLAWDDIDNDEVPNGLHNDHDVSEIVGKDIDHAVVWRVLQGEVLPTNTAERREIMRRWLASGRSEKSLCARMGWKDGRYTPRPVGESSDDSRDEREAS